MRYRQVTTTKARLAQSAQGRKRRICTMTDRHDGGLMQGNNTLSVSSETMHRIVQAWLDVELASPVTVKNVKHIVGATDRFEIAFERNAERAIAAGVEV